MVQWLRLHASSIAGGTDLIPGLGTKIPHAIGMTKTSKQTRETRNSEGKEVMLKVKKKKQKKNNIGFDHTVLTLKY